MTNVVYLFSGWGLRVMAFKPLGSTTADVCLRDTQVYLRTVESLLALLSIHGCHNKETQRNLPHRLIQYFGLVDGLLAESLPDLLKRHLP